MHKCLGTQIWISQDAKKKGQCYMYNRSSFGQAVASIYL